jgi:hypothetical protein
MVIDSIARGNGSNRKAETGALVRADTRFASRVFVQRHLRDLS